MKATRILRKFTLVLVIGLVTSLFSACATPDSSKPQSGEVSGLNSQTTISMWMLQEVDAYTQSIKDTIAEFEAENQSVKINLETIPADAWYSKIMTAMQSGELPQIMYLDSINKVSILQSKGVLEPVDPVIDEIGRSEWAETSLERYSKDNAVWSIPDVILYQAVFYRTDLFEKHGVEIPQTWDELQAAAEKLTIDEDNDGTPEVYGMGIPLSKNMVADQTYGFWMYSNGVHIFNPETGEYEFGSKKAEAAEALSAMLDVYRAASPNGSINWAWGDYRGAFVEGKVAMSPGWGAEIAMAQKDNPEILDHIGIFPFPAGPSDSKSPADTVGDAKSISLIATDDADKASAAKAFLTFFLQPDRLAARANTRPVFAIPATASAFASEVYKSNDMVQMFSEETAMLFDKVIPYTFRTGGEGDLNPVGSSIEATMILGDAIHNVILEDWSTEDAINWIDEQIQTLLQEGAS